MRMRMLVRLAASAAVAASLVAISWARAQDQNRASRKEKDQDAAAAKDKDQAPAVSDENSESADRFTRLRNRMVERYLVGRGIKNPRVLEAFRTVPRHKFLPPPAQRRGYEDESIPIAEGQTLTAPYDVAFMTEVLNPKPTDRVYEVGTGSGFQSAILSRLVKEVYSVEIHAPLAKSAAAVHKELGYTNIHTRTGDGYEGWPEAAPFDAIIVTCAPQKIPAPLFEQLKEGGRMVIPLGDRYTQIVHLVLKRNGKRIDKELKPTLFVPMTGRALEEAARAKRAKDESKADTSKGEPRKE
jgi:protein-L-isoaspartate(D-aspartate) O-methyltransferase